MSDVLTRCRRSGFLRQVNQKQLRNVHKLAKLPVGQSLLTRIFQEEARHLLRRNLPHPRRAQGLDVPRTPVNLHRKDVVHPRCREIPVPAVQPVCARRLCPVALGRGGGLGVLAMRRGLIIA